MKRNCEADENDANILQKPRSVRGGPRTATGKQQSKYNALRHGFFANLVLGAEPLRASLRDFERLRRSLSRAFRPQDAFEKILLEKIVIILLRQSRIYKADLEAAPLLFDVIKAALAEDHSPVVTEFVDKDHMVAVQRREPGPELLLRYENSLERQLERILTHFERWRRLHGVALRPRENESTD